MLPIPPKAFSVFVVLLLHRNDAAPTTVERMTVKKMSVEDLDSSASEYVYNQQQGLPVYYVQYTNHGSGRHYHTPDAVQYVVGATAPVAHTVPETTPLLLPYATAEDVPHPNHHQGIANYDNEQLLEHAAQPKSLPRAPYYLDGKITVNEGDGKEEIPEETVGDDHGDEEEEHDDNGEEEEGEGESDRRTDGKIYGGSGGSVKEYGGGSGHEGIGKSQGDEDSSFESGKGEKDEAEEYSEMGEKEEKGYRERKKYSEGESGNDDSARKEGYYKNRGGQKKGHVDVAEKHGSHEEAEKGKEGNSYGHSSYHKKGHKTNGFHNVYHKDEYKKETDFYDDDHKKGHFSEYEEFDKGYNSEEGGFKKGGHHSSGHDYQDRGKKGHYDKGHHENQDQGYQGEKGDKSYYSNREDYDTEEASKSAKSHGFSKKDR